MNYIKNNLVEWLEQDEQRCISQELMENEQETRSLLTNIINEFSKKENIVAMSSDYFLHVLSSMHSDWDVNLYITTIESLISVQDDFIYRISDITDEEYLLLDAILYSITNNHEKYILIHNLLKAYSSDYFL